MNELLVFVSAFVSVFALGIQSQNVNQGHYVAAAVTSFFISTGAMFLYRFMPSPTLTECVAFYLGAASGIVASMWFHRRVKAWWAARKKRRHDEHMDAHLAGYCPRRTDVH